MGPMANPKYKEYAFDIVSSGQHLLGIVNNILLFSKIEAGRIDIEIERLNLEQTVSDVVRIMKIEATRRHVRLVLEPFPVAVMVNADLQSLKQILFNVIGNAIKFSNEGGEVRVAFGGVMAGGTCRLQIVDHGCGIPEKVLSELGAAFVQADNTYARKHQGTGLGLAICFGLADHMGASVEVASVENIGTTVSIVLPINRAGAATGGSTPVPDRNASVAA
jgi:two-component system cell cycle sensor histidine kinase PleC